MDSSAGMLHEMIKVCTQMTSVLFSKTSTEQEENLALAMKPDCETDVSQTQTLESCPGVIVQVEFQDQKDFLDKFITDVMPKFSS